jgi:SAM-dependent methyltransferase
VNPEQFYTGLVAELYAPLRSGTSDAELYRRFVVDHGEPGLELGCGDGDPILALRAAGLDVDGVDSSDDMLERCTRRAAERGVTVSVYRQLMQELDLPRRYRSVYVAGGTFTVLPDDEAGLATLRAIARNLEPGGAVLIPLWVPPATPPESFGQPRVAEVADGTVISVAVVAETRDARARTRTTMLRYERHRPAGPVEVVERPWLIHWYTPDGFARLAELAGLLVVSSTDDDTGRPASEKSGDFTVILRR